jgi:uncharacterized phage protein (TIGR01671 family)|nr:MAG TPA: YopX protein [Caudoviricetes sp.]
MRKILFRAKHVDDGGVFANEWVCGDLCHYANGTIFIRQQETGSAFEVLQKTIGQSIGQKDRTGKDIYEGDIVECRGDICKVVYSDHFAGFALDKKGWAYLHFFGEAFNNEDCAVIGNIYDNPELLKGGIE